VLTHGLGTKLSCIEPLTDFYKQFRRLSSSHSSVRVTTRNCREEFMSLGLVLFTIVLVVLAVLIIVRGGRA
jgi:hypothetical protein